MALTLYVDTTRWRAHHKHVQEQFPGLVPVCKGNGYGFGHERLAEEATRLGSDVLGEALVAEAVAVALADRDQSRELLLHVLVMRPPARGVDVERERHGRTWNLSGGCGVSKVWEPTQPSGPRRRRP